jgi:hypothetical protein
MPRSKPSTKPSTDSKRREQEQFQAEAGRMRLLDRTMQQQILDMHRSDAANRDIPKADRDFARRRVAALEALLKLAPKKSRNL